MHAVIRTYAGSGAKKLFEELENHKAAIEKLIRPVKGLVSYALVHTADGGISLTICQDKAGIDESVRLAADFIRQNVPATGASPPTIKEGTVVVQIK